MWDIRYYVNAAMKSIKSRDLMTIDINSQTQIQLSLLPEQLLIREIVQSALNLEINQFKDSLNETKD